MTTGTVAASDQPSKRRRKGARFPIGPAAADLGGGTATSVDVVDCHAYILPAFDVANGVTAEEKLSLHHRELAAQGHTCTLQTEPERAFTENASLVDPATSSLREGIKWERDELGRPSWQVEDKRFVKGNLPSHIATQGGAFPVEQLLAAMDFADVSLSILQHDPSLGDIGPLYREATARHPQRFRRLITILEADLIPSQIDAAIARIDAELALGQVVGFQFFTGLFGPDWDDDDMRPFWDHLAKRQVAVWFSVGASRSAPVSTDAAMEELFKDESDRILAWCSRYQSSDVVISYGLPWRSFLHADRKGIGPLPKWAFKIFEPANVHLELALPVCIGDVFDFPYKEAASMVERMVKRVGARRLLFGSGMPFVERCCTYSQSVRHVSRYCDTLSVQERATVLAGSARKLIARADAVSHLTEQNANALAPLVRPERPLAKKIVVHGCEASPEIETQGEDEKIEAEAGAEADENQPA